MAVYETSVEEDIKILAEDDANGNKLGYNKRNCVLYRKGEKMVLQWFKEMAAKITKFMNAPTKDTKPVKGAAKKTKGKADAKVDELAIATEKVRQINEQINNLRAQLVEADANKKRLGNAAKEV